MQDDKFGYVYEVRGRNGVITVDDYFVTITRTGFMARATIGKGQKSIPIASIVAIQFKEPDFWAQGYIEFTIAGGIERRSRFGSATRDQASNENAVIFASKHLADMRQICAVIQQKIADRR